MSQEKNKYGVGLWKTFGVSWPSRTEAATIAWI